MFGSGIGSNADAALEKQDGGDVDDVGATGGVGKDPSSDTLAEEEQRLQIEVDDIVSIGDAEISRVGADDPG